MIRWNYVKPPKEQSLAAKATAKAKKARRNRQAAPTNSPISSSSFRVANSPNGFRVLIGRNRRQNDELSKTVAKDDDLWFHARGYPGSHVVLKLDGRSENPDSEDIKFAAEAAAWFSKVILSSSLSTITDRSLPQIAPATLIGISLCG